MYFTKEDLEQIRKYIIQDSIKDSEFPERDVLRESDWFTFHGTDGNKKIKATTLFKIFSREGAKVIGNGIESRKTLEDLEKFSAKFFGNLVYVESEDAYYSFSKDRVWEPVLKVYIGEKEPVSSEVLWINPNAGNIKKQINEKWETVASSNAADIHSYNPELTSGKNKVSTEEVLIELKDRVIASEKGIDWLNQYAYDRLDTWESYTPDKGDWVVSAALGKELDSRVVYLEGLASHNPLDDLLFTAVEKGNAVTDIKKVKGSNEVIVSKGTFFNKVRVSGGGNVFSRAIVDGDTVTLVRDINAITGVWKDVTIGDGNVVTDVLTNMGTITLVKGLSVISDLKYKINRVSGDFVSGDVVTEITTDKDTINVQKQSLNLGVYALKSDLTSLNDRFNDFLTGSDSDNIINKWKELEAFLSGMAESDNLAELLSYKVPTSRKVIAGTGLTGGGTLTSDVTVSLATTGVKQGTYTKVTIDEYGRVTSASNLTADDFPSLSGNYIEGTPPTVNGSGNVVSDITVSNGKLVVNKNITALTSHQNIHTLTFEAGTFEAGSYTPNSAAKTIKIPTKVSHLSNDLSFITSKESENYVTLNTAQTITAQKTFFVADAACIILRRNTSGGGAYVQYEANGVTNKWQAGEGNISQNGGFCFWNIDSSGTSIEAFRINPDGEGIFQGRVTAKTLTLTSNGIRMSSATNNYLIAQETGGQLIFITNGVSGTVANGTLVLNNKDGYPGTNAAGSWGSPSFRWANIYSVNGNFSNQITSTVANGTPPLVVSSTTLNKNLNADMLDGIHATGLFSAMSFSNNTLTVTIGGVTKTVSISSTGGGGTSGGGGGTVIVSLSVITWDYGGAGGGSRVAVITDTNLPFAITVEVEINKNIYSPVISPGSLESDPFSIGTAADLGKWEVRAVYVGGSDYFMKSYTYNGITYRFQ